MPPGTTDLPDEFAFPSELAGDPARQAAATVRAYIYQIWWSIEAWLKLRTVDEVIYLEGAEDFDKVEPGAATASQVKNAAKRISLNTQRAHAALENFWSLSQRELPRIVDFHYISTESAAAEQDAPFGGVAGIEAWRVAQTSLEMASAIQSYLTPKLQPASPLRLFLASVEPEQVQNRLIRRFHWFLDQPGLDDVKQSVDDRLVHILNEAHVSLSYLERVKDRIYAFACDKVVLPEPRMRRLTSADLVRQVDAATRESISVPAHQLQQFKRLLQFGAPDTGAELLRVMCLPLPAAPFPLLPRPELVEAVRQCVAARKAVLLTGSVYKGKTTVAQLAANALCPDAWWFPVSSRSGTETDTLIRALAAVVGDESGPALVVIDDIDLAPNAYAAYRQSLALAITRANRAGRGLLLTARGTPGGTAPLPDFAGMDVIEVTAMSIEEVLRHSLENGCPDENAPLWSALIQGMTQGHPKLVQVRIAELAAKGWPEPQANDVLSNSPAITTARQVARRLLSESVAPEAATFVYSMAEATFPMTRPMLLELAHRVGGIANGGDVIDSFQGKWLEFVTEDRLSVTPILKGAAADVWPPEQHKLAHRRIYDAIASVRTLDVGDAASLLFHAYIAQDSPRLAQCVKLLETIEERTVSSAIYQQLIWLPYAYLSEGQRLFESNQAVSALLRSLQFTVASETESDSTPRVLDRWIEEISLITDKSSREALELHRCSKMLSSRSAKVSLRQKLKAIVALGKLEGPEAAFSQKHVRHTIEKSGSFVGSMPVNATSVQFFLALQARFVRSLGEFEQVIDWLEHDSDAETRLAFEEVLGWHMVQACGSFVHGAWSARHSEETNWNPTLVMFSRADSIARRFGFTRFGSEVAKGASIIYGEHVDNHAAAIQVLDSAVSAYGDTPTIREQRVNALFQFGDYKQALEFWDSLIADPLATKSIDAFAFRRAGICACRTSQWERAERYFLAGAAAPPELCVEFTRVGLMADASHVAALAGEPQRAARMLSDLLLDLPDAASEDGHENWEAFTGVVWSISSFIEATAKQSEAAAQAIPFGKASEPGLSFGQVRPNQRLRVQLVIAYAGLVASQLGSVSAEYRSQLRQLRASNYPLVRFLAAKAALAFEINSGAPAGFVEVVAAVERAHNTLASLPDRAHRTESDGGDTEPTKVAVETSGLMAAFSAAAICCDRPLDAIVTWTEGASMKWGIDSKIAKELAGMARGFAMSPQTANETVRSRGLRSYGETVGAALALLRSGTLDPKATHSIQVLLASATVYCSEGLLLQNLFCRQMARRFAPDWKIFSLSPFNFVAPRRSLPVLIDRIRLVEQGEASAKSLLESTAASVGAEVGEVISRLE